MQIVLNIFQWYKKNKRDLPWRSTNNPYFIWLSEVILQQTQVVQGLNYYYKFIENFPTVHHLAAASEEDVLKLWQGLGYYSRARNLHKAAQVVVRDYNGEFPKDFNLVLKLPGIGPYTASAIVSMAYELPYPVIDGNVFRFIARLYGIDLPINEPKTYKIFHQILSQLMDSNQPSVFNNAMMEIGAIVCKPKQPQCVICPVLEFCEANKKGIIAELPVKTNKIKIKKRYFNFVYFKINDDFYIEKRTQNDIWENLYQLPLFESKSEIDIEEIKKNIAQNIYTNNPDVSLKMELTHQLTHQKLMVKVWMCELNENNHSIDDKWLKVNEETYKKYPIPKLIEKIVLHLHC